MGITKNASLEEIGKRLLDASSVLVFTHHNPDGDALGCGIAVCETLRGLGKEAYLLLEEPIPHFLEFMDTECCTEDKNIIPDPDVCICVDCSGYKRFETIRDIYDKGRTRLCVDHHLNEDGFGDYYYIDSEASAAAVLIYRMLRDINADINRKTANAIYIGISTDTGNFKYSNTSAATHRIVADLFDKGIDHDEIMINLYQNIRLPEVEINNAAVAAKTIFAGGRGAICSITKNMLEKCNAEMGDTETVVDSLRDIEGVEIASVLREANGGSIRVSLRAKSYADVLQIARRFGGGGHVKSAGCTLHCDIQKAEARIKEAIEQILN